MTNDIPPRPIRADFATSEEFSKAVKRWKYANDSEAREKKKAANMAYAEAHRQEKREHERSRYAADLDVRRRASERSLRSRRNDPLAGEKRRAYQNARYQNDEAHREKILAKNAKAYFANHEERKDRHRAYYHANKDELNERYRDYRLKWYDDNREYMREKSRQHYEADPSYYIVKSRLRQFGQIQATPKWLTKEQKSAISSIYRQAKSITKLTGVKHVVDHIDALNGKNFCGLHVPWNLRVITEEENLRKGNGDGRA